MQIIDMTCVKLVENYDFMPIFCGKLEEKYVEKCVQKLWIEFVQKSEKWINDFIFKRLNVKKFSFSLVLQKRLNKILHRRKWWLFPIRRGFCTFST